MRLHTRFRAHCHRQKLPTYRILRLVEGKRLIRSAFWVLLGRGGATILTFLSTVLVARMLTVQEVGWFFLFQTAAVLIAVPARLGLDMAIVRFVTAARAQGSETAASQLAYGAALAVLVTAVAASLLGLALFGLLGPTFGLRNEPLFIATVCGTWAGAIALQQVLASIHWAHNDIVRYSLYRIFLGVLLFFGFLLFAWTTNLNPTLTLVVVASILSGLASAAFALRDIHRAFAWPTAEGFLRRLREMLLFSSPLILSGLAVNLTYRADLWVVGAVVGVDDAAVYAVASRLVIALSLLTEVLNGVILPQAGKLLAEHNLAKLETLVQRTSTAATVIAVLILAFFALFGEQLVTALFGADYGDGIYVMMILLGAQFAVIFSGTPEHILVLAGKRGPAVKATVATAFASIALAIPMGLVMGSVGVAAAVALCVTAQQLILRTLVYRLVGIRIGASFGQLKTMARGTHRHFRSLRSHRRSRNSPK